MLYWQFRLIGKSESVVCGKSSYLKDLSLFSKKLHCNNTTYLSIHKYYSDIKIYTFPLIIITSLYILRYYVLKIVMTDMTMSIILDDFFLKFHQIMMAFLNSKQITLLKTTYWSNHWWKTFTYSIQTFSFSMANYFYDITE